MLCHHNGDERTRHFDSHVGAIVASQMDISHSLVDIEMVLISLFTSPVERRALEDETKLLQFCGLHIHVRILQWKISYFDSSFIKIGYFGEQENSDHMQHQLCWRMDFVNNSQ